MRPSISVPLVLQRCSKKLRLFGRGSFAQSYWMSSNPPHCAHDTRESSTAKDAPRTGWMHCWKTVSDVSALQVTSNRHLRPSSVQEAEVNQRPPREQLDRQDDPDRDESHAEPPADDQHADQADG